MVNNSLPCQFFNIDKSFEAQDPNIDPECDKGLDLNKCGTCPGYEPKKYKHPEEVYELYKKVDEGSAAGLTTKEMIDLETARREQKKR